MQIREATMADTAALAKLKHQLTQEMSALAPAVIAGNQRLDPAYFAKYIVDENGLVLVADNGAGLVGFALAVVATTQDDPSIVPHRFVYISDLFVVAQARRQGHGTALMAAVEAWAKQQAVDFVELNVLGADQAARAFYQQHGFAPQSLTLTRPLGD